MDSNVTCVLLGHGDKESVYRLYKELQEQSLPPSQIIIATCCMDTSDMPGLKINDEHVNDTGQRLCDYGLRLAQGMYTFFASSDDGYDNEFIKKCLEQGKNADLILAGFRSHLVGEVKNSEPREARVTRGSFLVKTETGRKVGYNSREYSGDWHFIRDVIDSGAGWVSIPEVLHYHN